MAYQIYEYNGETGSLKQLIRKYAKASEKVVRKRLSDGWSVHKAFETPSHKKNNEDLTGKRFGMLLVVGKDKDRDKTGCIKYICKCDCGNVVSVRSSSLNDGNTSGCGCRLYDTGEKQRTYKHGMSKDRLYVIWSDMKDRCNNPNTPTYKHYGGRGITVCDEWNASDGFVSFRDWAIANNYMDGLTIDRIDNNKGYSPDNCRWVTTKEQALNTRRNHRIAFNGKNLTITEWADELGFNRNSLGGYIRYHSNIKGEAEVDAFNDYVLSHT